MKPASQPGPVWGPYPGVFPILGLACLGFLAAQTVGALFSLVSLRLGLIVGEGALVMALALFMRRYRTPEHVLLLNAVPGRTLLLVLLAAPCAAMLLAEADLHWGQFLQKQGLGMPLSMQKALLELQVSRDGPDALLGLLAVALVPALCEELFFRGFVFGSLSAHYGAGRALIVSSVLFALAHLTRWQQLPALLVFGVFLGWLVWRTHSLYPAVLAHLLNNLLSYIGVNLEAHANIDLLSASRPLPLPVLAVALVIFAVLLYLLYRIRPLVPLPQMPSRPRRIDM